MRTQKIYCLFFFILSNLVLQSQTIDSISYKSHFYNKDLPIESRVESGISLVESYFRKDNFHALKIAHEVKDLSFQARNPKLQVKSLLIFGKALNWTQNYKKAKEQFQEAKKSANKINETILLIDALCGLAHAHHMLLEKDSAAIIYINAIKLVEKENNITKKAEVYIQFAEFNRSVVRYNIAIDYLNKVRTFSVLHQLPIKAEIEMYNRYAAVWNESNTNLDSAIYYSELCISLGKKINDMHLVATSHNELASLKKKTRNAGYSEHLLTAIEIWKKMNYLAYEGGAIMNYFYFIDNPQKDKSNLRLKAHMAEDFLERAKDFDLPIIKQELHNLLAADYEQLGDTKKALKNFRIYIQLLLDNSQIQHLKALNEIQEKFENEKYQRIISEHANNLINITEEKERERDLRRSKEVESRNYLILSISLIFVVAIVVFLILRSRRQNQNLKIQEEKTNKINSQLELTIKEKELLLKEIHHRVKNNLQIVVGLLELQANRIDAEPIKKTLRESINRVRSMSIVHQKLYLGNDLAKVNVNEYIISLIREIEFTYSDASRKLEKKIVLPDLSLDIDTIIPIGLIITELLTNSFKYGFNNSNPYLQIEIKIIEEGKFLLIYNDNGPGMPKDFEFDKSRSLGIRLIKQLARQLNGNVSYKFDHGAKFFITFENSDMRKRTE